MIDKASKDKPALMVLPEFINHCSWYADENHSYSVALDISGPFINAIKLKSIEKNCFIVFNCTLRRKNNKVTGSNILINPKGEIIGISDKQVLMGNENNFLEKATELGPVIDTSIGKIGMFSCMDGVMPETPRCIALRGAQIMCNTLNSFASDEASLHIPVRAAENKVFVIAANKSGPLVPESVRNAVADKLKIEPEQLNGAGESQIISPDGTILAKAPIEGEHVICADIDVNMANNKIRPDGTNIFKSRRPEIYKPISLKPKEKSNKSLTKKLQTAVIQIEYKENDFLLKTFDNIKECSNKNISLISLPELFFINQTIDNNNLEELAEKSKEIYEKITSLLKNSSTLVATSIISKNQTNQYSHQGILICSEGIVLSQDQIHKCERHKWANKLGNNLNSYESPWGRIGIVVGGDTIFPEIFRLQAINDVDIVICPTHIEEDWEVKTGLIERSAENRISILASSRKNHEKGSLIIAPDKDFTLWTKWERPFDGSINEPNVTKSKNNLEITIAEIDPSASSNRTVTLKTNVVENRPWKLLEPMVKN
jgi:predicted amidohydrolase